MEVTTVPKEDAFDSGLPAVNDAVVHGDAGGGRVLTDEFLLTHDEDAGEEDLHILRDDFDFVSWLRDDQGIGTVFGNFTLIRFEEDGERTTLDLLFVVWCFEPAEGVLDASAIGRDS